MDMNQPLNGRRRPSNPTWTRTSTRRRTIVSEEASENSKREAEGSEPKAEVRNRHHHLPSSRAFWQDALADAPAILDLITDAPRVHAAPSPGERVSLEVADAIRTIARELDVPRPVVVLAAFTALLARYSRSTDVVVGVAVARKGSNGEEEQRFVPVRTLLPDSDGPDDDDDDNDDVSFSALVATVHSNLSAAILNAGTPLNEIVELCQLQLNDSTTPVFQATFTVVSDQIEATASPGNRWRLGVANAAPVELALHDLALTVDADVLDASLQYRQGVIAKGSAEQLVSSFQVSV